MWKPFRCRLFREHDYQVRREPGALCLECRRCGHRSRGWDLPERRVNRAGSALRLFIAENGEGLRAVRPPDMTGAEMWATWIEAGELRLTFGRED
jgi:hypothetical protein